jgi:16S rRNA (guanine527-N7)-methyltransferase
MENCQKILQQGLQELNITVDKNQLDALLAFIKLLEKWNKAYNLTSVRNKEEMAKLHILDSLAILPHIKGGLVADIGTGAGIPGIPLAIFLPETQFTLIDSNSKKTRFVQQAILELKLKNVKVVHARVEKFQTDFLFSTVIMRAFANLQDIMQLTKHLIAPEGVLLAMKGQCPDEELVNMTEKYSIIPITVPGVDAARCIICIEGISNNG